MAALISNMAKNQNLSEKKGNKTAYKYFQISAGLFQSIKDDFHENLKDFPTMDVKEKSITCLNKLMLASAQECILNIKIMENVHCSKLYKITSYLSFIYNEIYKNMENNENNENTDNNENNDNNDNNEFKFYFNSWKSIINVSKL